MSVIGTAPVCWNACLAVEARHPGHDQVSGAEAVGAVLVDGVDRSAEVLVLVGVESREMFSRRFVAVEASADREVVVGERVEAQRRVEEVAAVGVGGVQRRRAAWGWRAAPRCPPRPAARGRPRRPCRPPAAAHRRGSRRTARLRAAKRVRPRRPLASITSARHEPRMLPAGAGELQPERPAAGAADLHAARLGDAVGRDRRRRAERGRRGATGPAGPERTRTRT